MKRQLQGIALILFGILLGIADTRARRALRSATISRSRRSKS